MAKLGETIEALARTIEARRGADSETSWSARLIADPALAAKKLAEEAMETALAAVQGDRAAVAAESADLVYHWLALLAALDVSLDEVADALRAREGRSGIEEKNSRLP
ncbi:MAG TPA: phosphoribosyl-ATP diphosphatase [Caulobacteraceae bacterium]|jgi:phosphoribosyl-ATP pyrophosphohydrolase